jgi:hypothetical protein
MAKNQRIAPLNQEAYSRRVKCIPGVLCIENMTLFFLFVILVLLVYFYYIHFVKTPKNNSSNVVVMNSSTPSLQTVQTGLAPLLSISTRQDPFNDPYAPPLQNADGIIYPRNFRDMRGIPVNIETQGLATQYQQIGILENGNDLILPLMGRRSMVGRDKWQYYTISNTGTLNTKLPVVFQGRSCTSENGCDNISSGDTIYVKGYNETFKATIYENNLLQYIPY